LWADQKVDQWVECLVDLKELLSADCSVAKRGQMWAVQRGFLKAGYLDEMMVDRLVVS
jgi:hypothetical protein